MEENKDAILYVCSLIEFIGRATKNHRAKVVQMIGVEGIRHQLDYADVNHCLPFEQVSDEVVTQYNIVQGDYDTVSECRYTVPSVTAIGKVYQRLALKVSENIPQERAIYNIFSSFISDAISDFNAATYYQNDSYLFACYKSGTLLS